MKFIDLFAGLGGFHLALESLGHKCVLASEKDKDLKELYEKNFKNTKVVGDITELDVKDIPKHDILCAGFPCQPFSKAGSQKGRNDKESGNLIDEIIRILKHHQPKYFILENVPRLIKHNGGITWSEIKSTLENINYYVFEKQLSPHEFGIPQKRYRIFIVGFSKNGIKQKINGFEWPTPTKSSNTDNLDFIRDNLSYQSQKELKISKDHMKYLNVWQELLHQFTKNKLYLPSHPIWADEFNKRYDISKLKPSKQKTILNNRAFYKEHKKIIDPWLPKITNFAPSFRKFEWQCKGEPLKIFNQIIQFRPSGIRIKTSKYFPTLVAMNHRPIIGKEKRYISIEDACKLQCISNINVPNNDSKAFKAIGNAVNVSVVKKIAANLNSRRKFELN